MKRRNLVLAGAVGAAAAAAGIGAAWWRLRPEELPLPPGFWQTRFEKPEGGELVLANYRGKPLVLNFWATWCPPCITELPLLERFQREQQGRGWSVLALAVDSPTPVREFLGRVKIGFPVGLAGLDGTDLVHELGNLQGGLPFTVVIDTAGRIAHRKMGETSYAELAGWVAQA